MTTTEQLLSEACVRLVQSPTLALMDASDRLARLHSGDTTPFEEYGYHNTDAGWTAALDAAETDVVELLREPVTS